MRRKPFSGPDDFADADRAELARRLADASGPLPDTNVALSAVRARVASARRRRTAGLVVSCAAVTLAAGAAVVVYDHPHTRRLVTTSEPESGSTLESTPVAVSYTHLTLPTNREV